MRRSTFMDRSALWLTFPPRYTNSFVRFYTWPAASTLNMMVDSGIPFAQKHMISVLASDRARTNAAHTTTIIPITFLRCSVHCEITPASSALICPKAASPGLASRHLLPHNPPPPFSSSGAQKVNLRTILLFSMSMFLVNAGP